MNMIKTKGNQTFNVPNTDEGREFLALCRKYLNKEKSLKARGRGSRKEHGSVYSIPQKYAEWFAVYLK